MRLALIGMRAGLYVLCVALALAAGPARDQVVPILALTVVCGGMAVLTRRTHSAALPLVEAALAAVIIGLTAPPDLAFLPYLLVPAAEAGLRWGVEVGLGAVIVELFMLLLVGLLGTQVDPRLYVSQSAEWLLLALTTALVAAWARRLSAQPPAMLSSYAAAYRLLSQLRTVSRQLPGGLDASSLAATMLETLRNQLRYTRAAVYVRSEGGRLVPLTFAGVGRPDWIPSTDDDSAWAQAWTSGRPQRATQTFSDAPGGYAAVIPMRVGLRVVGLVGMERLEAPFTAEQLDETVDAVDEAALRIDTALLFSDVRQIAAVDERRRMAREIHDGIAQELASIGYMIDDMSYRASDPETKGSLEYLRTEITRVISELRLSIFDLRSDVDATTGLGAALSDYVRQVGATSHLTVHLLLDESPQRLGTEAETELLRIAQEAVTNVRKHARADNLWVTCRTAPPAALLRVEDDGLGLGPGRADSYGMEIMKERARRLGARLTVRPREGGGTVVQVSVHAQDGASRATDETAGEGEVHAHHGPAS